MDEPVLDEGSGRAGHHEVVDEAWQGSSHMHHGYQGYLQGYSGLIQSVYRRRFDIIYNTLIAPDSPDNPGNPT